MFIRIALCILTLLGLNACSENTSERVDTVFNAPIKKPNILFISIDDLRPELGSYGSKIAKSPNLDALAAQGLQFNNAYTQQAICGPSRSSAMTGGRPDTIGVTNNYVHFRDVNPNIITLPQHFIQNGYETAFFGKIYHGYDPKSTDQDYSWSRAPEKNPPARPITLFDGFALPENQKISRDNKAAMHEKYGERAKFGFGSLAKGPAFESADVPDNTYDDGYNTDLAISAMKDMASQDKPFFLALGFRKPHLNWVSPKKYWDLYKPDDIELTTQTSGPENGSALGLHPSFELRVRDGIPKKGAIDDELAVTLKHAYLACISYVDAQVGRIIHALEEQGLRENTIIIVWSDHGWHLGEMGTWGKATNYEIATRVPLMIWTPDMPDKSRGIQTSALVELVDMYPTLSELAGLNAPKHLEGQSFVPLLTKPNLAWKKAAFSQFPTPSLREWGSVALKPAMRETYFGPLISEMEARIKFQQKEKWNKELFEEYVMGYAMRTATHRLVAWKDIRTPQAKPLDVELYDHVNDPSETKNIAAQNPKLVAQLLEQLNLGWQGSLAVVD